MIRALSFPWQEMVAPSSSGKSVALQLFISSILLGDHYVRVNEGKVSDFFTQTLHKVLPLWIQNKIRDSGLITLVADVAAYIKLAFASALDVQGALDFWSVASAVRRIQYGDTSEQIIEVFEPQDSSVFHRSVSSSRSITPKSERRGTLVFVHGGAWGCGRPWHYRMVANGLGAMLGAKSVVVVGYPTYPLSTILMQRDFVSQVLRFMQSDAQVRRLLTGSDDPWDHASQPITLSGHSSGANICALALLDHIDSTPMDRGSQLQRPTALNVTTFIGFGGVYDIGKHYPFEANRGVHMVSPMCAAACGRKCFGMCSPTVIVRGIQRNMAAQSRDTNTGTRSSSDGDAQADARVSRDANAPGNERCIRVGMPRCVLIHGRAEMVVPCSSSIEFATALRSIGEAAEVQQVELDHMQPLEECAKGWYTPYSEVGVALRAARLC